MEPGHETESPRTVDETPLPIRVDGLEVTPAPAPTPAAVLAWIAETPGAWFPARFAADGGVPRDSLDDPLTELRLAGLVIAAEWVRGVGQGYALTPAGKAVAADPAALERLRQEPRAALLALPQDVGAPAEAPAVEVGAEARDADLLFRPPVVVPALLMANAVWFFVCVVWGIRWGLTLSDSLWRGHPEVLHRFGAVTGTDLLAGEWWRLFSACFVHIGGLHLIGNLFALAMMGPLAELLWGRGRLLLIYFASGLAGSALAMAIRPDALLAGASGAIWGVQMSLFAWLFTFRYQLPTDLAADWFRRLTVVFMLNAAVSFLPNVSWEGHLGGGVAGFVTAGLLNAARSGGWAKRALARLLVALVPVFAVAGLAGAMGAKGMTGWQKLHARLNGVREAQTELDRVAENHAAALAFEKELQPRLIQLVTVTASPKTDLAPAELNAVVVLNAKRTPERTARAAERVRALKRAADEVAALTAGEPRDERRARLHRYAVARAHACDLLLGLLAADRPTPAAWDAWQTARRDALALR